MPHADRIVCIINNYSYFQHSVVSGPKSFIELLKQLRDRGFEVTILVPTADSCGAFPKGIRITNLTLLSAIKSVSQTTIILCDRGNLLQSIFLSIVFRKKLVVRMLGLGNRLQSRKIFSLRNIYSIATRFLPPELIISTLDGSYDCDRFPVSSKIARHRVNGVHSIKSLQFREKDLPTSNLKFFFIGRDAEEKGVKHALRYFADLKDPLSELHLFGPTAPPDDIVMSRTETDRVFFHGFVDRAVIERVLPNMDIMISANKNGCLGNAELETISFGKPIIYLASLNNLDFIPASLREFYLNPMQYQLDRKAKLLNPKQFNIGSFDSIHECDAASIAALL